MNQVSPLRFIDKVMFWMGMPFLLVMLGAIFLNQDQDALRSFLLFIGHSLLLLIMISEKKGRFENEKSQTKIFLAWLIFGFGIGCFLWNEVIGAIAGLIVAILAIKGNITTSSITFRLGIGWILNMYVSFTYPYGVVDQLIYLFSANIWEANAPNLGTVSIVLILILVFRAFQSGAKVTPVDSEGKEKKIVNSKGTNIRTGTMPVIYTIVAALILFIASLMMQDSENPFVHFLSNLFLYPFQLEFSKTLSVFITAAISTVVAFLIYCFSFLIIKTKLGFYMLGTFLAYIVYTAAWLYLKAISFSIQDIVSLESIILGILILLASIVLSVLVCFLHFTLTKDVYEDLFIPESKAYQKRMKNEQEQQEKNTIHVSVPDYTENLHFESKVSLISDPVAIENIRNGLEGVAQRINMNLTSDAATKLRLVSELFTKQISIHNKLSLEKMDQYSRIQSLYDKRYISEELYRLLSTIRKLGNTAVHEFGDDDRFNKNGLLKLHRQFLEHLSEWIPNDQNEASAAAVENDFEDEEDTEDEYEYDYDDVYEDDQEDDYEDENDEDEDEEEKKFRKRYSASLLLTKEIKEKMKF